MKDQFNLNIDDVSNRFSPLGQRFLRGNVKHTGQVTPRHCPIHSHKQCK